MDRVAVAVITGTLSEVEYNLRVVARMSAASAEVCQMMETAADKIENVRAAIEDATN